MSEILKKYDIIDNFDENERQVVLMGIDNSSYKDIVIINKIYKSAILNKESIKDYINVSDNIVEYEDDNAQFIVIQKYDQATLLSDYLDENAIMLEDRIRLARGFLFQLEKFDHFDFSIQDVLINEDQIVIINDSLQFSNYLFLKNFKEKVTRLDVQAHIAKILNMILQLHTESTNEDLRAMRAFIDRLRDETIESNDIYQQFKVLANRVLEEPEVVPKAEEHTSLSNAEDIIQKVTSIRMASALKTGPLHTAKLIEDDPDETVVEPTDAPEETITLENLNIKQGYSNAEAIFNEIFSKKHHSIDDEPTVPKEFAPELSDDILKPADIPIETDEQMDHSVFETSANNEKMTLLDDLLVEYEDESHQERLTAEGGETAQQNHNILRVATEEEEEVQLRTASHNTPSVDDYIQLDPITPVIEDDQTSEIDRIIEEATANETFDLDTEDLLSYDGTLEEILETTEVIFDENSTTTESSEDEETQEDINDAMEDHINDLATAMENHSAELAKMFDEEPEIEDIIEDVEVKEEIIETEVEVEEDIIEPVIETQEDFIEDVEVKEEIIETEVEVEEDIIEPVIETQEDFIEDVEVNEEIIETEVEIEEDIIEPVIETQEDFMEDVEVKEEIIETEVEIEEDIIEPVIETQEDFMEDVEVNEEIIETEVEIEEDIIEPVIETQEDFMEDVEVNEEIIETEVEIEEDIIEPVIETQEDFMEDVEIKETMAEPAMIEETIDEVEEEITEQYKEGILEPDTDEEYDEPQPYAHKSPSVILSNHEETEAYVQPRKKKKYLPTVLAFFIMLVVITSLLIYYSSTYM